MDGEKGQEKKCLDRSRNGFSAAFQGIDVLPVSYTHLDVYKRQDMTLAEHRVLCDARDNLGDIMAEHLPDRVLRAYQFHRESLLR